MAALQMQETAQGLGPAGALGAEGLGAVAATRGLGAAAGLGTLGVALGGVGGGSGVGEGMGEGTGMQQQLGVTMV